MDLAIWACLMSRNDVILGVKLLCALVALAQFQWYSMQVFPHQLQFSLQRLLVQLHDPEGGLQQHPLGKSARASAAKFRQAEIEPNCMQHGRSRTLRKLTASSSNTNALRVVIPSSLQMHALLQLQQTRLEQRLWAWCVFESAPRLSARLEWDCTLHLPTARHSTMKRLYQSRSSSEDSPQSFLAEMCVWYFWPFCQCSCAFWAELHHAQMNFRKYWCRAEIRGHIRDTICFKVTACLHLMEALLHPQAQLALAVLKAKDLVCMGGEGQPQPLHLYRQDISLHHFAFFLLRSRHVQPDSVHMLPYTWDIAVSWESHFS